MVYQGSKNRIAKHILEVIYNYRENETIWVELFAGGLNMMDKVDTNLFLARIGYDNNKYLVAMWNALLSGWKPKEFYTREEYYEIKKGDYPDYLKGYVGVNCSYSGYWWGGYAGKIKTKTGAVRNYQKEKWNNIQKQLPKIKGVGVYCKSYDEVELPKPNECIIYCDPPYQNTTKYHSDFDHDKFWDYVREKSKQGYKIFVSEYQAPEDFECIWSKPVKVTLNVNDNKLERVEKLFKYKG